METASPLKSCDRIVGAHHLPWSAVLASLGDQPGKRVLLPIVRANDASLAPTDDSQSGYRDPATAYLSRTILRCSHHHDTQVAEKPATRTDECAELCSRVTVYPEVIPKMRFCPDRRRIAHSSFNKRTGLISAKEISHAFLRVSGSTLWCLGSSNSPAVRGGPFHVSLFSRAIRGRSARCRRDYRR
jgi:hypothetical protein